MRKLRILHYISGISPTIGGVEKFVLNFYEVQRKNIEIQILTRYCDEDTVMYRMFEQKEIKIYSLNIHHLTSATMLMFRHRLKQFFMEHRGAFDVLHMHLMEDPFVAAIAKKYGINRIVAHVHSYGIKSNILVDFVKKWSVVRNSHVADSHLACSFDVGYKVYPSKYRNKIKVIKNGIDAKKFDFDEVVRKDYREKLHLEDSFVVCTVGRLETIKNQGFLIDIFQKIQEKHQNSKLVLVGDGSQKNKLYKKCVTDGMIEKVCFLGDREDVNNILQAVDVFVLTSKSEGFGIVLVEAQASGLKTFAPNHVIPKTVNITDLVNLIDLEESAERWAECILEKAFRYDRYSRYEEIKKSGFDSEESFMSLMKIYGKSCK